MSTTPRGSGGVQYEVGWICALKEERAAADAVLDEKYENTQTQDPHDTNSYSFGRMANHNVVIASLPAGDFGVTSAATVAKEMIRSYKSIKIGLMVGIGGGVPNAKFDIRLGDVVISQPQDSFGGVVQYDRGKRNAGGKFERTGQLNKPPQLLLNALGTMQADIDRLDFDLGKYLYQNLQNQPRMFSKYGRPHERDDLFRSDYEHLEKDRPCIKCSPEHLMSRQTRKSPRKVKFHYGTIASGSSLIKSGTERDRISQDLGGILCFEMEAAGLMDNFPCLVIRGICDYADSHKNDTWHKYAAMTAACYAKKLLSKIPGTAVQHQVAPYSQYSTASRPSDLQQPAFHLGPYAPALQQPSYQPYDPSDGYIPVISEGPVHQTPSHPRQTTMVFGQPVEQHRSLSSDSIPSGILQPSGLHQSPASHYQPFPRPGLTPVDKNAPGYNQSSMQYMTSPPFRFQPGSGPPSAYPSPNKTPRSIEGVSSTLPQPSLALSKFGYTDPGLSRSKEHSAPSSDVQSKAVSSLFGGVKGYAQQPHMAYPQIPRSTHPARSRLLNDGQSVSAIPLRPMPRPLQAQSQAGAPGALNSKSYSQGSTAAGGKALGTSKSFDASYQGYANFNVSEQGDTKSFDRGQLDRGQFRPLPGPEAKQKAPRYPNDPKSTAPAHKGSSDSQIPHLPLQYPVPKSRPADSNPSDKGHKEKIQNQAPKTPTQNLGRQGNLQVTKPPAGGGQETSHLGSSKPHSKHSPHQDHPKQTKSSGNNQDHLQHTMPSDHKETVSNHTNNPEDSKKNIDKPSSSELEIDDEANSENEPGEHSSKYEPSEYQGENEPGEHSSEYEPSEYQGENKGVPSPDHSFHSQTQGYPFTPQTNQSDFAHSPGGYPTSHAQTESLNNPYAHSHNQEYPPYPHPPSTNDDYSSTGNNISYHRGGEAAAYYSSADKFEDGHLASPAMNAYPTSAYNQYGRSEAEVQGDVYGSSRDDSDDESNHQKATRAVDGEEADEDDSYESSSCHSGDDNEGGCCDSFWSCCRDDEGESGCCDWNCCGDGNESDDGKDHSCCTIM